MKNLLLGSVCACFIGTAAAGDLTYTDDARYADSGDYSARLLYQFDFGSSHTTAQSVSLRFDNVVAASRGAPAMFMAKYDGNAPVVSLEGMTLRGSATAVGQSEGGGVVYGGLTTMQWVSVGIMAVTAGVVTTDVNNNSGVGGSGGS